jgi:ubiquinone/menaquinone biosynthesis C-methylase UbiE
MPSLARWLVNLQTTGRARRTLADVGASLALGARSRILELGCGRGGLAALVQERYQPARFVATDFDPQQVRSAATYLAARLPALPPSLALQRVGALSLPYRAESFDVVFAIAMLHHVEPRHGDFVRRPAALAEIRRVLRPGGLLAYSEFSQREQLRSALRELGFAPVQQIARGRWDVAVVAKEEVAAPGPGAGSPASRGPTT